MNLSFDAVLDNHETRELFRKHLQNAITTESLSLFEAVEKYSLQRSDINRFKSALKIVQTYVGSGAPKEVNISEESRIILQATLVVCSPKDCPRGLFDKIVADVVCNMKQDSFPRFLQSRELAKFLGEKETQLGAKYQEYLSDLTIFDPQNIPQHEKLNTISCSIEECHEGVSAPKISLEDPKELLSDEELSAMCKAMRASYNGIPAGDRKVTFKTHAKCFRASEIVTWLCSYQNVSRKEALLYFTTVQNRKRLFVRVNKKKEMAFKDTDNVLYRFRERKHVVLLGGGFANVVAARKLEEEYDVTLVDPKTEFECIPSFPLLVSDPGRISRVQHDYRSCLKHTRVITDWVAQVTPKRVYLSGKVKHESDVVKKDESTDAEENLPYIEFDHLIVGTGGVKAERFKIVKGIENCAVVSPYEWRTIVDGHFDIENAKHIVVAGGGSMAVEIASEVLHYHSNVKVTMIVSGPSLMHLFDKSVAEACASKLAKFKNLNIVTDAEVTLVDGRTVHYRNKIHGKADTMDTDVIMVCTGTRPNSGVLRKYMPHALRSSDGGVLVNKSFQVKKEGDEYYTNIFAVGDVTAINEVKLANLAMHHGRVIADVINAIECGVVTNKLPQYKTLIEPLTISFGPDSALLILNGKVIANNMIVREIKYKLETKVEFVLKRNKRFLMVV